MANGKSVVVTAYGHEKTVDRIAVSLFDKSDTERYGDNNDSNAATYCHNINGLELKGDSWVFAKIIPENSQFTLDSFLPMKFDIILKLSDLDYQKVQREIDSQVLAKAMKGESEAIQEKVFSNMSKRAAQMLKEDMEYMGPIPVKDAMDAQEKILMVIHHLEDTGEIVTNYSGGTIR